MTDDTRREVVNREHAKLMELFGGQYGPIHRALEACFDAGAAHGRASADAKLAEVRAKLRAQRDAKEPTYYSDMVEWRTSRALAIELLAMLPEGDDAE